MAAAVLAVVLLLGACTGSGDSTPSGTSSSAGGGGASTTSEPTATPSAVPLPAAAPPPAASTCGGPEVASTGAWLRTDGGALIAAWSTRVSGQQPGDTVVLLHQTNDGACGFWAYAAWLADRDVRAVLVDFCGYGRSVCPAGVPWSDQAVPAALAAVEWARSTGATRVTLVGASVGGTVAVSAAAQAPAGDVDAVVDLAGPVRFAGLDDTQSVAGLGAPLLAVVAEDDVVVAPARLSELVDTAGPPSRLLTRPAGAGHGWALLRSPEDATQWSAVAGTVRSWALGQYS